MTQTTFIEGSKLFLTQVHDSRRHKSLENAPTYENSQGKAMFLVSCLQNFFQKRTIFRKKLVNWIVVWILFPGLADIFGQYFFFEKFSKFCGKKFQSG